MCHGFGIVGNPRNKQPSNKKWDRRKRKKKKRIPKEKERREKLLRVRVRNGQRRADDVIESQENSKEDLKKTSEQS